MTHLLLGVGVFFMAAGTDVVWARYTLAIATHHSTTAGVLAAGIIGLQLVYWEAFYTSRWLAIPAALGAAIGTFVAVEHAKRSRIKERG